MNFLKTVNMPKISSLSSITSFSPINFVKENKMSIVGFSIVAVILFGIGFIYVKKINTPFYDFSSSYKIEGMAVANNSSEIGDENRIVLWYADWCPHCKAMKQDWETIRDRYDEKSINGRRIKFEEVNCTNVTPDIEKNMDANDVKGFPTIKLFLSDGTVSDFDAKPTADSLDQFLNSVL